MILIVVIIDVAILILVEEKCETIINSLMAESFLIQVLGLILSMDSKFTHNTIKIFNVNPTGLKIGAIFIVLISFYIMFLAKQGIPFQNPIIICA